MIDNGKSPFPYSYTCGEGCILPTDTLICGNWWNRSNCLLPLELCDTLLNSMCSWSWASLHQADGRLIATSRKVPKPLQWMLHVQWLYRSEMWQASWQRYYRTGVLSDIEWLNTTQLKYPDCSYIVESDTSPSHGVTRLCPSWLGTWLTWSPSGHCNMQWDTCYHLVAMAAGERELPINHITWLHHEEYWNIHRKFKTPKWHSNTTVEVPT